MWSRYREGKVVTPELMVDFDFDLDNTMAGAVPGAVISGGRFGVARTQRGRKANH